MLSLDARRHKSISKQSKCVNPFGKKLLNHVYCAVLALGYSDLHIGLTFFNPPLSFEFSTILNSPKVECVYSSSFWTLRTRFGTILKVLKLLWLLTKSHPTFRKELFGFSSRSPNATKTEVASDPGSASTQNVARKHPEACKHYKNRGDN